MRVNIIAAGILYYCKSTGKVLLGKRGADSDGGNGNWACFGGKLEEGETLLQCAVREVEEETGYVEDSPSSLRLNYRSQWTHGHVRVVFYCFMRVVEQEFELPELDKSEHSGAAWFSVRALPKELLPPFKANFKLDKLLQLARKPTRGVAQVA